MDDALTDAENPAKNGTGLLRPLLCPAGDAIGPLSAAFNTPLKFHLQDMTDRDGTWNDYFQYLGFTAALDVFLLAAIYRLFQTRWRVAE